MQIAENYRQFALMEARGNSPLYEQLALGVADDREMVGWLAGLPPGKRQPNLLFAAVRLVSGTPAGYAQFRENVLDNRDAITATMLSRRTQTNEPGRCTGLYPILATLPQPLALLEVGASAGLCLLLDRYRYDYDGVVAGDAGSPLTLRCRVEGGPYPVAPGAVTVAWRAGIDLNPLDVTDPGDVEWLRTLVWPEQQERLARLDAAIALAQADPPRVVAGDLNEHLVSLAAEVPRGATLVVMHTAVLWYLPEDGRSAFRSQVKNLGGHWLSQETPGVFPHIDARLPALARPDALTYVLSLDGEPLAFSAVHGGWIRRLA